jgi:hypothetical protein
MSQGQWIILLLRIVLIAGFVSLLAWIADYTRMAPWWTNPIGRTLVTKTAVIAALLIPTTLSLFLNLNRTTSNIVAWLDVVLIGLVTPVMLWRIVVFRKIHKHHDNGVPGSDA